MNPIHRTQASVTVDAPAEEVYRTLTDVANWPLLYPWIAHTEIVERTGDADLSKFWAVRPGPEGGLRIWESRRTLHDGELRMEFEQQGTVGAIRRLGGEWLFLPEGAGRCRVESRHWFTTDEDPAVTAEELDRHGALQMRTLKEAVEGRASAERLVLRARRSTVLPGTTAPEVHAHLCASAGRWERGAPQAGVAAAGFAEAAFTEAEWEHPDGTVHLGPSVRIARAPHTLVLKSLEPYGQFALHRCVWRLEETPEGVLVTAEQLAVAHPEALDGDTPDTQDAPDAPAGSRRERLLAWLDARAAAALPQGAGHLAG
ncbi:aromatase/cyclase [Streptomyces goshikiensis]|uniref:aromatase/cyclase n=1 Tax=Streptomyces goshikiensis TaxID=1942 RepID=UPI00364B2317